MNLKLLVIILVLAVAFRALFWLEVVGPAAALRGDEIDYDAIARSLVSGHGFSLTAGEALSKLGVFFWFGLGFGIPLLALSLLSGSLQRQITRLFALHARKINLMGGILLIGVGLYDLWANWELIGFYLGAG